MTPHTVEQFVVGGRVVRFSSADKVLYRAAGLTKADVRDYYLAIAPTMLAHLGGRALTMRRWPDGIDGQTFYEKHCPTHKPDWVRTTTRPSGATNGSTLTQCVIDEPAGLVWAAQLAAIELHVPLARAERPAAPTAVVFDLDPGTGADAHECCKVAQDIHAMLHGIGLDACAKTSGKKGVQVYVPIDPTDSSFDRTKAFAKAVARLLEDAHPDLVVSSQRKDVRRCHVLVDWSQNDVTKTTVCAYSLRATQQPGVSTPITWDEVARGARRRSSALRLLKLTPRDVLKRVEQHGDLFAPVSEHAIQVLPTIA